MPYADDPNLDEQNSQSQGSSQSQTGVQGNTQLAGGGTVTGGASQTAASSATPGATSPGAASAAAGAGASPAPTHPSNYQDLNAYLDANSGSGFGQQFVGNVNNDVNAAQTAQTQGANLFKGAADAGVVNQDPNAVNAAINDPYAVSQDPTQTAAFQSQLNATYNGPQSYSDDQAAYQTAYGATQKAEDTAQAAQTEGGRFALLNNYFGTPNYNQGQMSLDNLLIQADPTTAQGIQQAKQNADQSLVSFQNQAAPLQQYAAQDNATTQATANAAQTAANNALTGLQSQYGTDLSNAQSQYSNAWSGLQSALSAGPSSYASALTPYGGATAGPSDPYTAAWNAMEGVTPPASAPATTPGTVQISLPGGAGSPNSLVTNSATPQNPYWGVDATSYLTQAGGAPDASNVLTLAQQQRLDALQGLMGQAETPYNATEAGAYNPQTNGISFNSQGFQQAEQTAANNYAQSQAHILGTIKNLAADTSVDGSIANHAPGGAIQQQYDQLNAIRAQYGLPPVQNPYFTDGPGATGPGVYTGPSGTVGIG